MFIYIILEKKVQVNDDITTKIILRDYQNKVIYSSIHYNVGIPTDSLFLFHLFHFNFNITNYTI